MTSRFRVDLEVTKDGVLARRTTEREAHALRMMATARLADGEHPDDLEASLARYLVAMGWESQPALRRAEDAVREAAADRDGFAGGGMDE